jgi:hypothetical protein
MTQSVLVCRNFRSVVLAAGQCVDDRLAEGFQPAK